MFNKITFSIQKLKKIFIIKILKKFFIWFKDRKLNKNICRIKKDSWSKLNTYDYNLFIYKEIEKQKYILEIYNRVADKIQNIYTYIDTLFNHLIKQNLRYIEY